jgi:hypothetical protein
VILPVDQIVGLKDDILVHTHIAGIADKLGHVVTGGPGLGLDVQAQAR